MVGFWSGYFETRTCLIQLHKTFSCCTPSSQNSRWVMCYCLTPLYLRYLMQPSFSTYNTRSASHINFWSQSTHPWVPCIFSSLQLATGTSSNKHSNWTVLTLHSKTQSWTLLLSCGCFAWCIVVSTFLPFVLLSVCPTMFVPCFVMLPCCVVMCCCHAMLSS